VNKYLFCVIFLFLAGFATAQKKPTFIHLISSETSHGIKKDGKDLVKVYKAVFQQDFSILSSDSAYFYPQANAFDAFGHVVITQGDTLHVYSDKLNYNGNTKTAILTDHVVMVDKDATLTTDYLTYNTGTRIGTYTGGGKLVNKDNTLTSKNGYYFAFSRDAYFRYNVVLNAPDAIIKTDTLRYNSGSRIAYFYGPTHIYGKSDKDTLYTENGTYNTQTEQAFFGKKNYYHQGSKSLKGDSLFYDRLLGYGKAVKNVTFNDNEQKITIKGNLGISTKVDERTMVTQNAYVVLVTDEQDTTKKSSKAKEAIKPAKNARRDSIFMSADTIETQILTYKNLKILQEARRLAALDTVKRVKYVPTKIPKFLVATTPKLLPDTDFLHKDYFKDRTPKDTTKKAIVKPAAKSLKKLAPKNNQLDSVYMTQRITLSDTARIRILTAAHHSKIFKSDLQAKADSIFYSYSDSTARLFVKPIIWAEGSQLTGDTIYLQLRNKKVDNMEIFPKAFIVNVEGRDSTHFNQVSGKKMRVFFKDSKISRVYVDGNAETVYYIRDSTKITGLAHSVSSRIRVDFAGNNNASVVTFLTKPEHKDTPLSKVKEEDKTLKNFVWRPKERPVSKESIIASQKISSKKAVPKNKAKGKAAAPVPHPGAGVPVKQPGVQTDSIKFKTDTVRHLKVKLDTIKKANNEHPK
jgi:lipopolysaccharide export system protein LptA